MAADDPLLWLEEIDSPEALEWVQAQDTATVENYASDDDFAAAKSRLLEIYDSNERIPHVVKRGEHYYNFWKDADHERGLWRRTSLESYRSDAPDWEVVLDVDALAAAESENWVWHGATCLAPAYDRCLLSLSRGGADASVVREYDVPTRSFVDGGFELPEAKSDVYWIDRDTVWVGTDFGEGSLTESGYPRVAKQWRRGTPLAEATTLFEGRLEDVAAVGYHDDTPGWERDFVEQATTFFTNRLYEVTKGKLWEVPKQESAVAQVHKDKLFLHLREDWDVAGQHYTAGSLLATDYKRYKKGAAKGKVSFDILFAPDEHSSLESFAFTQNTVVLTVLRDVQSRIEIARSTDAGWERSPVTGLPEGAQISASPVDPHHSDDLWFEVEGYLTPTSLWLQQDGGAPQMLKSTPDWFDASRYEVSQHFAPSKDGTRVPYFQIAPKERPLGDKTPTLLYGYGGFEVSLLPAYSGTVGAGWLERGGVYVIANIRGGGEYGPRWHQAALKEKRHRAYEDFAAVGEDLVKRGITTREHLGIMGGSNGGLLMGNMYTLYPDHWGAIVCAVPLLDMKRYTKLLAGASWAGEYGDPDDPEQWAFIQTFSPYHNIDAARSYPPILFTTSTRDDRVHPGHARKMARALMDLGKDVAYYENIEGGHGGAANNEQSAFMKALSYTFLWEKLSAPEASAE